MTLRRGVSRWPSRFALSGPWRKTFELVSEAEALIKRRRRLGSADSPVFPHFSAGQGGEGEVGSYGEAADAWRRLWSWEASSASITSAVSLPSDIQAGEVFRHLFNLLCEALFEVGARTSRLHGGKWFVPASGHGGGVAVLWLDGGEREGPDCFVLSFSEVFSTNARDLYVICNLMGSFVTICKSTALDQ
jgi:hypothetical protein